jgi:NitT/TauT family transport system substrate-binding protein
VHFGLTNSEAAIKLHWKRYPESKPKGDDEAKIMRESRHIFVSRFNSYQLDDTDKYGESFTRQWKLMADQMKEQRQLPADFDVEKAYTNEFVDAANKWDRNAVLAQAKSWRD